MEIYNRPKLNLKITLLEVFLNSLAIAVFIGSTVYLISSWTTLPSEVPTHFNGVGEVDGSGSKGVLIILPVISLIMWVGMTILEKFPHMYNYPKSPEGNERAQYLNARLMINVLKNVIVLDFSYLTWKSIQIALGHQDSLGAWSMPIFLLLIFGPMAYFVVRSFRLSKE